MSDKFKDYAKHHLDCNLMPCTCGLDELLKSESPSPLSGEEIKPFDSAGELEKEIKELKEWRDRLIDEKNELKALLNSGKVTNGASQEKPDSSASDGKQNNSSNSGEQQECKHIGTFTATGRAVCMKCGKEFEQQPVTGERGMDRKFINYLVSERDDFVNKVNQAQWNTELRKQAEKFLIAFDQLLDKYTDQPPTPEPGELYWKQRCEAAEDCSSYETYDNNNPMNLYDEYKKAQEKWQQLKNQEVEKR